MSDDERPQYTEIGDRLRALRSVYGGDLSQKEWASTNQFPDTTYNNWETGTRRIPLPAAERLADRYGLSLDWIYRGKVDGLSESTRKLLSSHLAM